MAWSVDDIYSCVKSITQKNQSGSISPTDLFYAWNVEQHTYFQDLVGRWQARAGGKQGANTGLIANDEILSELAQFISTASLTIASGSANKPSDYIKRLSLRINDTEVCIIRPDQIAAVKDDVIDPPSVANDSYFATEYATAFKFLPTTVTAATLDYLAACTDIVWGYTLDGDGRPVYASGSSVQPKWTTPIIIEITKRALVNLGVKFKDADFTNYGRNAQITGD